MLYLTLLPSWMYSWKDQINPKHFLLSAASCITRMIYTISVGHTLVNRNSAALTVCAGLLLSASTEGNEDTGRVPSSAWHCQELPRHRHGPALSLQRYISRTAPQGGGSSSSRTVTLKWCQNFAKTISKHEGSYYWKGRGSRGRKAFLQDQRLQGKFLPLQGPAPKGTSLP